METRVPVTREIVFHDKLFCNSRDATCPFYNYDERRCQAFGGHDKHGNIGTRLEWNNNRSSAYRCAECISYTKRHEIPQFEPK